MTIMGQQLKLVAKARLIEVEQQEPVLEAIPFKVVH